MSVFLFVILMGALYLGTRAFFHRWLKKQPDDSLVENVPPMMASVGMGGVMIGVAGAIILFPGFGLKLYVWLVGTLFALMYTYDRWQHTNKQWLWIGLFCFIGTWILHQMLPQLPIDFTHRILMTIIWIGVVRIVMWFDRLPLISLLTVAAWALAFSVVSFMRVAFPLPLTIASVVIFVPLWAAVMESAKRGIGRLGAYGSCLLGFIMGGIIAALIVLGAYGSVIALLGYYEFEIILIGLGFIGVHVLDLKNGMFAFETMLIRSQTASLIKVVFSHIIVLSLMGTLLLRQSNVNILMLGVLIVLLDLYNRFKSVGKPAPKIKEMWRETKASISCLWKNVSSEIQSIRGKTSQEPLKSKKRPIKHKMRSAKRKKKK